MTKMKIIMKRKNYLLFNPPQVKVFGLFLVNMKQTNYVSYFLKTS